MKIVDGSGVAHVLDIMLADSPTADIQHHFELCVAFINDALASGGRVLVTGSFYTVGPFLERLSARD